MNFRLAEESDIKILNKISFSSKSYWGYPSEWMDRWRDELTLNSEKLKKQHVLILELADNPIGFCSMVDDEENYEILHLWVLPEFIGKGYGTKLLDATFERFAKEVKPIIVEADPNAEDFYKSQGFVTFDRVESYPKGRFLPVMQRAKPGTKLPPHPSIA